MTEAQETPEQKVRRVAQEIQDLLVKNRCMMTPTISLQVVPEEKTILTPPGLQVDSDTGETLKMP